MKKCALLLAALLLSGCSAVGQIEGQAFAVAMAVDMDDYGNVTVSVKFPSYGAKEEGGDGKSDYLLASGIGKDFSDALYALNAAMPRALNLTQVKSFIVSAKVASSELFITILRHVKLIFRLDGETKLVVAEDNAGKLLAALQPLIGLRLSDTLVTELARYEQLGTIPHGTVSGAFYAAGSIYGDATAVLAAVSDEPDAAGSPEDSIAGRLAREGENKDEYFGAALFRGGMMVGRLTGRQTQLLRLVAGGYGLMPMQTGQGTVRVGRQGPISVCVDLTGEAPRITVAFTAGAEDTDGDLDEGALRRELTEGLNEITALCQRLGVDPFDYARHAAAQFLTIGDWLAYDWRSRFPGAEVRYLLKVERINR